MHRLISYLKVVYLQHLFCIFEIVFLIAMYKWLNVEAWLHKGSIILKMILLLSFKSIPFFPQLDAWSRYQNYKMLRDEFYYYGFQPRLIKPFIKSRCQRDAVLAAAEALGFGKLCWQHFYAQGYRWYHILPNILLSKPGELFNKQFWQTTFFEKKVYFNSWHCQDHKPEESYRKKIPISCIIEVNRFAGIININHYL